MARGLFQRVYSPIHHTLAAAKNIVNTGVSAVDKMGSSLTQHANQAVTNVFTRARKGGARRKAATRRNRRAATRKTRSRRAATRKTRSRRAARK